MENAIHTGAMGIQSDVQQEMNSRKSKGGHLEENKVLL